VGELREYATRRGWHVSGEYLDTGWSGAKASRPELDRLMKDAALRRFDAVLVWKLDRFGRSVRNCLDGIELLRAHGVRFMAVSQSIDTDESNPTARLLLHLLASVAEFERELIRERVRAGIKSAKHKGTPLGRKRIIFDRSKVVENARGRCVYSRNRLSAGYWTRNHSAILGDTKTYRN
jgi:putative DNA-invertase from lambdoid prophage Rac